MASKQFDVEHDYPPLSAPSGKPILEANLTGDGEGTGSSTFLGLTDTPADYIGYAGYVPIVAGNEAALGFIAFDHDLLTNTHNLTTDIDHDLLTNYVAAEHIDWSVTGIEQIHIDRLDLNAINAPDDDFHVNLSLVTSVEGQDEVLISDFSDSWNYKRITYSNFISALGTVENAYYRITADSGVTTLDASGESELIIAGDGDIIRTVGASVVVNSLSLSFIPQSANLFLAGPSSGLDAIPTFRALIDADMPVSYEVSNWNDAYTHSLDQTTNPHNITLSNIGGLFTSDINVVLAGGKTLGQYSNGDTIPATGLTPEQVLNLIAVEYINASFTSFSVSGQATTVEVGTTLSGLRTFTWSINEGSGDVNYIDIYDITDGSYLVEDTENVGSDSVTLVTNQLNSDGAIQQWRGIGHDITPEPDVDFNSSTFTVTARYYRFYGPDSARPTDDTTVRALPSSNWQTGTDIFDLWTGTTETLFYVILPPGVTISYVSDLTVSGADITSEYVLVGTVTVVDAGSTNRSYNLYEMSIAVPYGISHQHRITAG